MKNLFVCILITASAVLAGDLTYPVVDTGQTGCYNNTSEIQPAGQRQHILRSGRAIQRKSAELHR